MTQVQNKASPIMEAFLQRTKRYLWTDAYAVQNLLRLGEQEKAVDLIQRVHRTLARHREDDERTGWLSGLSEEEGWKHPTRAGLRIGKPLPERLPDQPLDDRLEWERDGQYFHYLTRWAQALLAAAEATGQDLYRGWARELMVAAGEHFVYRTPQGPRMYWKMSVDLSRPQVPSMGHHDPLDGLVTSLCIGGLETEHYRNIVKNQDLVSTDPLGIGGLLSAANRLRIHNLEPALQNRMVQSAVRGLEYYRSGLGPEASASGRLGFRELGLAIGVRGSSDPRVEPFQALAGGIVTFWSDPKHQSVRSWEEHLDINEVMLASSYLSRPEEPF